MEINGETFPKDNRGNNGILYSNEIVMLNEARKQSSVWKIVLRIICSNAAVGTVAKLEWGAKAARVK
jgi:hypothetical protein